jgi:hypothetical protein
MEANNAFNPSLAAQQFHKDKPVTSGFWFDLKVFMINEFSRLAFTAVYLMANAAVFTYYFLMYFRSDNYATMYALLGDSLPIARGSAGALYLNGLLILLPVCRNTVTLLRSSFLGA